MPSDLPAGYRWATAEQTEAYHRDPASMPEAIIVQRTTDSGGWTYTQDEADVAVPEGETEEFTLTVHFNVSVPRSLVPTEDWGRYGVPKRLYDWPAPLRDALHTAMVAQSDELPEYDEASWDDHDDYAPSTN